MERKRRTKNVASKAEWLLEIAHRKGLARAGFPKSSPHSLTITKRSRRPVRSESRPKVRTEQANKGGTEGNPRHPVRYEMRCTLSKPFRQRTGALQRNGRSQVQAVCISVQ